MLHNNKPCVSVGWGTVLSSWRSVSSSPVLLALLKSRIPVTIMASSLSCCSLSLFKSTMKAPSSVWGKTLCRAAATREEEEKIRVRIQSTWSSSSKQCTLCGQKHVLGLAPIQSQEHQWGSAMEKGDEDHSRRPVHPKAVGMGFRSGLWSVYKAALWSWLCAYRFRQTHKHKLLTRTKVGHKVYQASQEHVNNICWFSKSTAPDSSVKHLNIKKFFVEVAASNL